MTQHHKLYKLDTTGKVRVWWMETDMTGRYRTWSGIDGGNIATTEWTTAAAKNEGRSNATTPQSQALAEVTSQYNKKGKRGYVCDLEDIETAKNLLISPMLAHDFAKHGSKLTFPVYAQPKLDGIRCLINSQGAWSRNGEPITTIPHISSLLVDVARLHNVTFDGELYNHELKDNFNRITSLVRKQKTTEDERQAVNELVQYHVYDLITPRGETFEARANFLGEIFNEHLLRATRAIKLVSTYLCHTPEELDDYYGHCLERGYEGQMVRSRLSRYERKRTTSLLKRKEFQDEEFIILDVLEGLGNRSGMVGALQFMSNKAIQFNAALMGTNEFRERIWRQRDKVIGLTATVKYFHLTPDGAPRFPVVKHIRGLEDMGLA